MNPDLLKNLGFGGETKQAQTSALQNFSNRFKTSNPQKAVTDFIGPVGMTPFNPSGTSAGVKTPQSMPQNTRATQPTQQYGMPEIGYYNTYQEALNALNSPKNNPPAVNINVANTIPPDALNTTPSTTTAEEKRKASENRVLQSRFQKEEEALLGQIASLRSGVASLRDIQAREYNALELNPMGQLRSGLTSDLNRLSEDQALELNARVGQLNVMLDTLETYQGYRPQMVGTPFIDEVSGEAYAYLQDPMTGELFTESLGQVVTPAPVNPYENYLTLSEGETVFDPATGQALFKNPKTFAPTGGGSQFGSTRLSTEQRAMIDWENPDVIDSLPVSPLTKAVMSGTGSIKDLTPTMKAEVLQEMYAVGYSPNQVLEPKLRQLEELWQAIPNKHKGLIQGLNPISSKINKEASEFESAKTLLTRQIARLYDVGVLSDMDVKNYRDAMPSRTDSSIDVVRAKLSGISSASTGKQRQGSSTPAPGSTIRLEDGRYAIVSESGDLIDPVTGELME